METETEYCDGCKSNTSHLQAGFMPEIFTKQESTSSWERVSICTECGGLTTQPVTNEEVKQAHSRYLSILVDEGIVTERELQEQGYRQ